MAHSVEMNSASSSTTITQPTSSSYSGNNRNTENQGTGDQQQQHHQQQRHHQQDFQHLDENSGLFTREKQKQQRVTSSFSSAVEIYQSKLNSKITNKTSNHNIGDVSKGRLGKEKLPNSRVNVLRTEISRLREEMLLKINALETEMYDQIEPDEIILANEKSTQTEHSEFAQSLGTTNRIPRTDDCTQTLSIDNNPFLVNNIMLQFDMKLEHLKKEIFDKLEICLVNNSKEDQITNKNNETEHHIPVSTPPWLETAPKLAKLSPDVRLAPSNMQHEYELNNTNNIPVSNYTRTSTDHGMSFVNNSSSSNEHKTFGSPATSIRSNMEIKRIFLPYESKSPIPSPYTIPSTRTGNNTLTNIQSPINVGDKSYYEPNLVYPNFDQYSQTAREELARHLVDQLFPYDDLADANVRGVKGKRLLDPTKIQKIRESVFRTYPVQNIDNEDYLWKFICDKINAKCRGVTRTLKRKSTTVNDGSDYTYRLHDYPITTSSLSLDYQNKYRKERYEFERCSFVTTDKSINFRNQPRTHSSSDSESSSIETSNRHCDNNPATTNDTIMNNDRICMSQASFSATINLDYDHSSRTPLVKREPGTMEEGEHLQDEEVDVKVTDDDEEDVSEGGESTEKDNEMEIPQNTEVDVSLDICDKLAEKYMDHLPNVQGQDSASERKRIQGNREEFTRTLIEAMFTRSTLAHSNVTGARGKFMLDPVKIAKVRETVFKKFPADNDDEEEVLWKILTTKINTKCRGVKRLMKRKGIPAECITKRYESIDEGSKHKVLVVKDQNSYPAIFDEDVHSNLKTRYSGMDESI